MNAVGAAWRICQKDLLIEAKSRDIVLTTGLFALLTIVLGALAFYIDPVSSKNVAPGTLWIAILFSGVLIMSRSWARERQDGAFGSLLGSPAPRASIYWGKLLSSWLFVSMVQLLIVPVLAVLFQLDLTAVVAPLTVTIVLGTFGFVASGTLFSAMVVQSEARDLVLSVVIFPLVAPALLAAAVATRELFGGASVAELAGWWRILLAFGIVVAGAATLVFEYLVHD